MNTVPEAFKDLLTTKKAFANLATINADSSPQVTPVWFDWDGRNVRINTAKGRVKDKNLRRTPAVALSIMDPDNPYRYVQIKGRVPPSPRQAPTPTSTPSPRNTSARTATRTASRKKCA